MKIKRNIAFKLRPYGKDGNLFQIRMRVTFNGRRFDTKTGCQINNLSTWDDQLQLVAEGYVGPKGETAQAINNELRNVRDQMDTAFKFFEATDKNPTIEELKVKYEQRLNGTVPSKPAEEKKERKPRKAVVPKYRYTTMDGEEKLWTGQGKTPLPLKERMAADGVTDKEHYRIPAEEIAAFIASS